MIYGNAAYGNTTQCHSGVFDSRGNYGNTEFPNRKYCFAQYYLGNPIWKFRVLQTASKMGKVTSPTRKAILLVNLFCFFYFLIVLLDICG